MDDHTFCRLCLSQQMEEVRKHFTPRQIKSAWAWKDSFGNFEFHGPDGEYFYGLKADCKWGATAEGWSKIMDRVAGWPRESLQALLRGTSNANSQDSETRQ